MASQKRGSSWAQQMRERERARVCIKKREIVGTAKDRERESLWVHQKRCARGHNKREGAREHTAKERSSLAQQREGVCWHSKRKGLVDTAKKR